MSTKLDAIGLTAFRLESYLMENRKAFNLSFRAEQQLFEQTEKLRNQILDYAESLQVSEKAVAHAAPKQETSCLHPDLVCDQQALSPTFNCADCKEHVPWQTVYRRLHVKIANLEKSVQRLNKNEELYGTTKP